MTKLLLLLGLLASYPNPEPGYPCETHEEGCTRGDNDDSDNPDDERPADPNGPDYDGDEDGL